MNAIVIAILRVRHLPPPHLAAYAPDLLAVIKAEGEL